MTVRSALDAASPDHLADHARGLGLGSMLAGNVPIMRRAFNFNASGTSPSHVATLHHMPLDVSAKAVVVLRAIARAGGVTGELAPQAFGATPATTQIAVAPNGDIVVLAADAITSCDVYYIPVRCEIRAITLPCIAATGVCDLPPDVIARGVFCVHKATGLVGTVTGQKRILVPGAVNPATPQCRLSVDGTDVNFTVADALTSVALELAMQPAIDSYAKMLEAEKTV